MVAGAGYQLDLLFVAPGRNCKSELVRRAAGFDRHVPIGNSFLGGCVQRILNVDVVDIDAKISGMTVLHARLHAFLLKRLHDGVENLQAPLFKIIVKMRAVLSVGVSGRELLLAALLVRVQQPSILALRPIRKRGDGHPPNQ